MNLLKTFAAASAIALASFGANAAPITSGGITWDPDYDNQGEDFFAISYNSADSSDMTNVSGFGQVEKINGSTAFCAFGTTCTLSYVFSGFNLTDVDNGVGGTLDFYVNDNADNITASSQVTGGDLWLSLAAISSVFSSETQSAFGVTVVTDSLSAIFNVVEKDGTVWSNFDTNTQPLTSDVYFVASQPDNADGSATFHGDSIPEPTTLAIFGLGLLGLAGAARRRKA